MACRLKLATELPRGLRDDSDVQYCASLIFLENISLEGCRLLRTVNEEEFRILERVVDILWR